MAVCQRGVLPQAAGQTPPSSPVNWQVVQLGFQEAADRQVPKGSNLSATSHPFLVLQPLVVPAMILQGTSNFSQLVQRRGSEERNKSGGTRWSLVRDCFWWAIKEKLLADLSEFVFPSVGSLALILCSYSSFFVRMMVNCKMYYENILTGILIHRKFPSSYSW